jgi:hypothetical protein
MALSHAYRVVIIASREKSTLGIPTLAKRVTTFSTATRRAYRISFDKCLGRTKLKGYR